MKAEIVKFKALDQGPKIKKTCLVRLGKDLLLFHVEDENGPLHLYGHGEGLPKLRKLWKKFNDDVDWVFDDFDWPNNVIQSFIKWLGGKK